MYSNYLLSYNCTRHAENSFPLIFAAFTDAIVKRQYSYSLWGMDNTTHQLPAKTYQVPSCSTPPCTSNKKVMINDNPSLLCVCFSVDKLRKHNVTLYMTLLPEAIDKRKD